MKPRKKDHPILMIDELVRATLAGRKTVTRRTTGLDIVNQNPEAYRYINKSSDPDIDFPIPADDKFTDGIWYKFQLQNSNMSDYIVQCPYGQPGDRLYVREAFTMFNNQIIYRADYSNTQRLQRWYPSLHMLKEHARIWLQITDTKPERLADITEQSAINEGIQAYFHPLFGENRYRDYVNPDDNYRSPISSFNSLMQSITNKKGRKLLELNPWVWVIEYKKLTP